MFFSLKSRLIAFIVALFVLSFGTLSFLLFTESRTVIRSYIESSALEKMEEYGSYVDMVQMQIYDVASLVFNSDTAKNWDNAISDPLHARRGENAGQSCHEPISDPGDQQLHQYLRCVHHRRFFRSAARTKSKATRPFAGIVVHELLYVRDRWSPAHTDQHERVRDHGNPVVSR